MKFVASSSQLLNSLQAINKVISTKNTLPILDNFLFTIEGHMLEIVASDLETTMITRMSITQGSEPGIIAIPARLLIDLLSKFSEQPLTFVINTATFAINIHSENGQYSLPGNDGTLFPQLPALDTENSARMEIGSEVLLSGISKTVFATGDDELRPVMNGIFVELSEDSLTFVASDAHKLVRYRRNDVAPGCAGSFILPKKPASLLRNVLPKESEKVTISFDNKNARVDLEGYTMVCRLVEGRYPSYNSVIPQNNFNHLTIDRVELLSSLRRVQVVANPASSLVKLELKGNQMDIFTQDVDFAIAGHETLKCQYEGDPMSIGFKSVFLIEILSNLSTADVCFQLSDPSRAGVIVPVQNEEQNEDVLMLLMPMMVNS
jgi:DNA polymerase-3 subunit beta